MVDVPESTWGGLAPSFDAGRLVFETPQVPAGIRKDAEWRRNQHRRATATGLRKRSGSHGRWSGQQLHPGFTEMVPASARMSSPRKNSKEIRQVVRPLQVGPQVPALEMVARSTWHAEGRNRLIRASSLDTHGQIRGHFPDSSDSFVKGRAGQGSSLPKGASTATHWHQVKEETPREASDWDGVLPTLPAASREASLGPHEIGESRPEPPNFIPLSQTLVERCGSLARAFAYFDPQHTGKVTRTRWDSALSTLHIDLQELCNAASKQVFKLIDCIHGHGKGEIQLEEWNFFFKQQLEGTEAEHLLTEDRGDQRPERRHSRRHSHSKQTLKSHAPLGESPSTSAIQQSQAPPAGPESGGPRRSVSKARESSVQSAAAETSVGEKAPTLREGSLKPSRETSISRKARQGSKGSSQPTRDASVGPKVRTLHTSSTHSLPPDTPALGDGASAAVTERRKPPCGGPRQGERAEGLVDVNDYSVPETGKRSEATVSPSQAASQECTTASGVSSATSDPPAAGPLDAAEPAPAAGAAPRASLEEPPELLQAETEEGEEVAPEHVEGLLWAEANAILELPPVGTDPKTVSLDLRRVISGAASFQDLDLSEEDFDAIALHEELCEDVSQLELAGIQALAYALIAKFGSLKKAFRYFDTNRQGRFGQVAWDNGLVLLRMDVERLSGFKPAQIFHMMDQEPQGGSVSRKKWIRFFSAVEEGHLATSMKTTAQEKGTLQQRARAKSHQMQVVHKERRKANVPIKPRRKGSSVSSIAGIVGLKDQANEVRKTLQKSGSRRPRKSSSSIASRGSQRGLEPVDPALVEKRYQQEDAFRQRALEELEELRKGDAMTYMNDCFTKWKPSENALDPEPPPGKSPFDTLHAEEKCEIVEEIADELGLWRLPRAEAQAAKDSFSRSATMAFLKPGGQVGGAVLVCHLRLFAEATHEQLTQLQGTNGSLEFPSTLSEIQRVVVHVLAATKGLTTLSEGSGLERRLVAYDTGSFAQDLRRKLTEIEPGKSKVLSESFSGAQRRLVHTMAMEMGLDVKSRGGSSYEVFNLKDFREEMQEELLSLGKGKVHHFGVNLSEQERQVVHETAMHLGLTAHTEGGRTTRHVTVANLKDFVSSSRARMAAMFEADASELFEGLTPMQMVAVETTATELGLHSARRSSGVVVSVSEVPQMEERRPSLVSNEEESQTQSRSSKEKVVRQKDEDFGDAEGFILTRETSQASLINMVFEAYASGHYRGQRTFLRFSDLKEFAEDMKELMPDVHKTFHHFTGLLEFYYDDTQQLQSDMGDHGAKGLTLRYFQVFVQKVLRRLGPQIVGVLFALIDQRQ